MALVCGSNIVTGHSIRERIMSAKRLYLHIGMGQTGTTSIQRYFADNAEALLRLHGLYYLYGYRYTKEAIPYSRHGIPPHCFDLFRFPREGMDFLREKSREAAKKNYRYLLISDEGMLDRASVFLDAVPMLHDIFPEHEIRIILYLRRADDWCKSHHNQLLKHIRAEAQRPFTAYCDAKRLRRGLFTLPETIRALAEAFGRENCLIRLYDRKRMKNGSSLDDFADIFGIKIPMHIPEEIFPGELNISLPAESLPYLAPLADKNSPLPFGIRKELHTLLKTSFEHSGTLHAKAAAPSEIARAVDELEALVPGYKKLYEEREFSLDWPELRLNPGLLAVAEVLYHTVGQVRLLQERMQEIPARPSPGYAATLHKEAARLSGREVYFWGRGDIYRRQKGLFAQTRPRCVLVDVEQGALPDSVDGIPVRHPKDVLPSGDILPIVVFVQNINAVYATIREQYPAYTDLVFVPY